MAAKQEAPIPLTVGSTQTGLTPSQDRVFSGIEPAQQGETSPAHRPPEEWGPCTGAKNRRAADPPVAQPPPRSYQAAAGAHTGHTPLRDKAE
ncbi:Hypothetical predicted protein [Pelobates cultripes]|uniref:Uncharacterized protein n=1 Tax=Pelobates cultripes TaxID=61616 RepID=A0AAD1SNE7_PELCU|nr:Hypothetical predicted protein [Pelobates cultripes]